MTKTLLTSIVGLVMAAQAMPQATKLANNEGLQMLGMLNNNKAVFYSLKTSTLWKTDGTAAGTVSFTNKVFIPANPESAIMNGLLYFTGTDAASGEELWVTDGTDAGTHLVKDINPGVAGSSPADRLLVFNNCIYFSAETSTGGREIWKSDGTEAGTVLLKDIVPGAGSSNQPALYKTTAAGSYIYFVCNTAAEGEELWRTDGTAAGTVLVQDIKTGPLSSTPVILGVYNNKLIFSAEDLLHGREPWMTDGSPTGTSMLKDIATGPMSSSADNFIEFNGKMLFAAFDITNGQELWQTDGTTAGTQLLKDIQTGDWGSAPVLYNAVKVGNKLFFAAFSNDAGMELWQTDGTTAGTQLFMDIEPGEGDAIPILLPAYANGFAPGNSQLFQGDKFFFAAFTTASGYELYISDGTVAGTSMVKNLDGDIEDGFAFNGYYISNTGIYFSGNDGVHKGELFKSDGTAAGTGLAASVNLAGGDGKTMPFIIINNALLFFGDDGNNPTEELNDLYRLNVNDVVLPVRIVSFNGKKEGSKNVLNWKVANAINFENFVIERSSDGNNFTEAGTVKWNGAADYSFTDNIVSSPVSYYRLRLTDRNNSFKYSNVIALRSNNTPAPGFTATKNSNHVLMNYHLAGKEGNVFVTDMAGRNLYKGKITGNSGYFTINVPSATQWFIITIQEGTNIISKRVF